MIDRQCLPWTYYTRGWRAHIGTLLCLWNCKIIEIVHKRQYTNLFGNSAATSLHLLLPKSSMFRWFRLCRFQWISLMGGFAVIHFMTWDYNDTQPGEEVNFIRLFNFFANPETPLLVTTILMGHVSQKILQKWTISDLFLSFYFRLFNTPDNLNFADGWIRTAYLRSWNQRLYQLSHNHCPKS